MAKDKTSRRKSEHLDLCLRRDVSGGPGREHWGALSSPWDAIQLPHRSLPEISFQEITLESRFLKHSFSAPILISSMTGGTPESDRINERLAKFAEKHRIPMGVGSQRILLENRDLLKKFKLRKVAPKATLFANIGAIQLNYEISVDDIEELIDQTQADGLFVHLNPLQEAIQIEGDRDFRGLKRKLVQLRKRIHVPMILKETGCGLDRDAVRFAKNAGFDAVDIAGGGGTHWGYIEGLRHAGQEQLGDLFRSWGLASPQALIEARKILGPQYPIIASGGIRHGLDIARALALGANLSGLALPFLKAAAKGPEALESFYTFLSDGLRVAMFCTATKSTKEMSFHG